MTHQRSFGSLLESVSEGCTICQIILESIGDPPSAVDRLTSLLRLPLDKLFSKCVKPDEPTIITSENRSLHWPFQKLQSNFSKSREPIIINTDSMTPLQKQHSKNIRPKNPIYTEFRGRVITSQKPYSLLSYTVRYPVQRHDYQRIYRIDFILQACGGVEHLLHARSLSDNTGSDSSLQQLCVWYMNCLQNHEVCKRQSASTVYRPTRLLNISCVGEQVTVRLVNSADLEDKNPYMTLSHCWGSVTPIRYTALTTAELESGLAVGDLPKTFQDAVAVARTIRCQYLWIDSLCIAQDDRKDWEVEAAQMDKVYSNAMLNIGATGSANSLGGLFFKRNPSDIEPCRWNFKREGEEGPDHAFLLTPQWLWEQLLNKQPMRSRGWCFQERILSCRMIDFTSKQLVWRCHELEACETYPVGFPPNVKSKPEMAGMKSGFSLKGQDSIMTDDWVPNALSINSWQYLVEEYSSSFLTKPEDKLIALSGLAKEMSPLLHETYYAGLWRSALPQSLLWCSTRFQSNGRASVRPSQYRAPSWSWASLDGEVYFCGSLAKKDSKDILIKILEARTTLVSAQNSFGAVSDGLLKVEGLLWPITLSRRFDKPEIWDSKTGMDLVEVVDCFLDILNEELHITTLFGMPIQYIERESVPAPSLVGLILATVDKDSNTFRRIGFYRENPKSAKAYYSDKGRTTNPEEQSIFTVI